MYKKLLNFTILQINIKNGYYIFISLCKIHACKIIFPHNFQAPKNIRPNRAEFYA